MTAAVKTAEAFGLVKVDDLVVDFTIYPRPRISDYHVNEIVNAMDGGHEMPAIIVERKKRRQGSGGKAKHNIVDGAHRWTAAIKHADDYIKVEFRDYASQAELFADMVILNSDHGMNFTTYDQVRIVEIGRRFKLEDNELARLLRTSEVHLKTIAPRYATVQEDEKLVRVPLRGSVRHFAGESVTPVQADALRGNVPGQSYLLGVRQLKLALQADLLPPPERHPALWTELVELRDLLNKKLPK